MRSQLCNWGTAEVPAVQAAAPESPCFCGGTLQHFGSARRGSLLSPMCLWTEFELLHLTTAVGLLQCAPSDCASLMHLQASDSRGGAPDEGQPLPQPPICR